MKIGVLVFGMYRNFDVSVKSWKPLDIFNCDYFFSTWSISRQKDETNQFCVTKEMILKYYPNADIDILNEENFSHLSNSEKMIFHWKNCLTNLKKSNKNYKYIILLRFDLQIRFQIEPEILFSNLDSKKLYVCGGITKENDTFFIDDTFFIGSYDIIEKIINTVPLIKTEIHHNLGQHINNLSINVSSIDFFEKEVIR